MNSIAKDSKKYYASLSLVPVNPRSSAISGAETLMKTPMKNNTRFQKHRGFTLVELLVVITIIAVLASLGVAGGLGALQKARKTTALATATNIVTGIRQFYGDYSILPDPSSATEDNTGSGSHYATDTAGSSGTELIEILSGLEDDTAGSVQNDRKLNYLSIKDAKNSRGGVDYSADGNTVNALFDPWGEPYYIVMDYDYDERLIFTPDGNGEATNITTEVTLNGQVGAVYSLATDTPADAKRRDIVQTW
jgi:prepilin-type N-terminal cleavage/methylation domain-containing protein